MTSSPPSPDPPPNRSRPDRAFGLRPILPDSAPAPAEVTAPPVVQMPATGAPRELAYTTALVAAYQRSGLHQTLPHCGAESSTKP